MNDLVSESVQRLAILRRKIAMIERQRPAERIDLAPFGHAMIDRHLGGGLARARLHEVFAIDHADASSAAGFVAMLALRLGGALVWLRTDEAEARGGGLYAPGLREIGIDPSQMLLGLMPDALAMFRAAAEVLRCAEVGVVVIELWRMPRSHNLTMSRRLAVAAEASGVTPLLFCAGAEPVPSAAHTRWAARAAKSVPLPANAPGHPAIEIELLRQRGRPAGVCWPVEWDRDQASFREPALSGTVVPAAFSGSVDAVRQRTG